MKKTKLIDWNTASHDLEPFDRKVYLPFEVVFNFHYLQYFIFESVQINMYL